MLKLKTHSGFHDLFLKSYMERCNSESVQNTLIIFGLTLKEYPCLGAKFTDFILILFGNFVNDY